MEPHGVEPCCTKHRVGVTGSCPDLLHFQHRIKFHLMRNHRLWMKVCLVSGFPFYNQCCLAHSPSTPGTLLSTTAGLEPVWCPASLAPFRPFPKDATCPHSMWRLPICPHSHQHLVSSEFFTLFSW